MLDRTATRLDQYSEFAEFYDLYVGGWLEDLPLYVQHANKATGPLLEIGAGTGRLTAPLAVQGFSLVAVDSSPLMLQRLRNRLEQSGIPVQQRVQIVEADVRTLRLDSQFDFIFLPYYTFNYLLTPNDQRAALDRLRDHLTLTGELMIDVFVPHSRLRHCSEKPVLKVEKAVNGGYFRVWNTYILEKEHQVEVRRHRFELKGSDGSTRMAEFITRRRYSFREELNRLFREAGLAVEGVFGGYDGQVAGDVSEQLLYVLRR